MARSRRSAQGPSWESADDIPMDDQDEFLANRDRIALGDDAPILNSARARAQALEDEEDAVQEVFRLPAHNEDVDDGDQDDLDEDDFDDEEDEPEPRRPQSKQGQRKQAPSSAQSDSDSDSDQSVEDRAHFGRSKKAYYASTNALDSGSEGSDGATTDEENELSPEQRRQMELREVRKMATAARKGMLERDFGLEDDMELAAAFRSMPASESGSGLAVPSSSSSVTPIGKTSEQRARERRRAALLGDGAHTGASSQSTTEQANDAQFALPTDPETVAAMLRDLHAKDALTLALAGEYADSVQEWTLLQDGMLKAAQELPSDHPSYSLMHIYQQTFLAYLTTLTFYFYLRTSPAYSPSPSDPAAAEASIRKLRQHPVVARLTELKEALANMEDLGFRVDQADSSDIGEEDDELAPIFRNEEGDDNIELGELDDGELDDLLADEKENQTLDILADPVDLREQIRSAPDVQDKGRKSKQKAAQAEAAPQPVLRGPLAELDDLVDSEMPAATPSRRKATSSSRMTLHDTEAAEAPGELTALTAAEKAEKQARKRSLRFYTGQIASRDPLAPSSSAMATKNGKSGALSGDADIPYTDRERSRRAVEAAAEAKRLRAQGLIGLNADGHGIALDGSDAWEEADSRAYRDIMGTDAESKGNLPDATGLDGLGEDGDNDDDAADYYDLVASAKQSRKKARKDAYDEARLEERYQPEETLDDGEHRGLNRTIEKNRGLTPHRPKAVRNPRVKKRLKYESAKKKLSSSRPVYKGGQATLEGGYGGEKSGISEGIVRSRSFS